MQIDSRSTAPIGSPAKLVVTQGMPSAIASSNLFCIPVPIIIGATKILPRQYASRMSSTQPSNWMLFFAQSLST